MRGLRWQPVAVVAGLLAPPVALAVAVWPAGASGSGGDGDDPVELAIGDEVDGRVVGGGATSYEITAEAEGPVRIDVLGRGEDPTLTVVDVESGEQLGFNDDSNGVDSSLVVDLEEGQVVRAEVRSFGGGSIGFTIRTRAADGDELEEGGGGPETTVPAGEAFAAPIGEEPIEIDGPNGVRITLYEDGFGNACMDVERRDGGSSSCAPSLAELAQPGGGGGSFDGRVSIVEVVTLVGPEVAAAAAVSDDGDEIELEVLAIPGRAERIVIGQIRIPGDAFSRPGGSGYEVELRDGGGAVLDSFLA